MGCIWEGAVNGQEHHSVAVMISVLGLLVEPVRLERK